MLTTLYRDDMKLCYGPTNQNIRHAQRPVKPRSFIVGSLLVGSLLTLPGCGVALLAHDLFLAGNHPDNQLISRIIIKPIEDAVSVVRAKEAREKMDRESVVHNGIRFSKWGVNFHPNGNVEMARLYNPQNIGGWTFKAGSFIEFHPNGKVKSGTLSGAAKIKYSVNGRLYNFSINDGKEVEFDPNENLQSVELSANTEIHGYEWMAFSAQRWNRIRFHPNGQIESGTLSTRANIEGVYFNVGDVAHFNEDGSLRK